MSHNDVISRYEGRYPAILIFGPPGSGKGTQGKFLCDVYGHYHLSSGDIFRSLSKNSPAGQLFHKYASQGHLVPDNVTIEIWKNYVEGLIATNRYDPESQRLMLDGIPRNANQAQILKDHVDVQRVIVLETPNHKVLIDRLLKRAKIEGRGDDIDPKVLETRMEIYEKETKTVLEHYPKETIVHINCDQSMSEVLRDILVAIN